jgi:hypothetical protein
MPIAPIRPTIQVPQPDLRDALKSNQASDGAPSQSLCRRPSQLNTVSKSCFLVAARFTTHGRTGNDMASVVTRRHSTAENQLHVLSLQNGRPACLSRRAIGK